MSQTVDASAIQQIRDLIATQQLDARLEGVNCPAVAVPVNIGIKSLEGFSNGRYRFRGELETASIDDFVKYSIGYFEDGARCFIDADRMRAISVFNLGTLVNPGHADNKATLSLKRMSAYSSLLNINSEKKNQKELAEWLEDWADFLIGFDAEGNVIEAKKSAAAVRRITIEANSKADYEDEDFSGKRSVMESVEAKTKDIMPVSFQFKCTTYEGLSERAFRLRLSIITGDRPILVLRVIQLEAEQEKIAEEFRDLLINKFSDTEIETFIGTFSA